MKGKKIITLVLTIIPALMMALSAVMKFAAVPQMVEGLTKIGILPNFPLPALALLETVCFVLFLIPKTWRVGFFLVCGYLGGATAIEIAANMPPAAPVLLTLAWIGAYLKDPSFFTGSLSKV